MIDYALTDPRGKMSDFQMRMAAFDATTRVQREVDEGLRVIWDDQRRKFVVLDTKAPGGPDAAYVMLVQEPDGSFRPFDGRTIKTLQKLRFGHDVVKQELAKMAAERERANEHRRSDAAESLAKDFRHMGQAVVPSVGWRDRTDPQVRERIRQEAGI